MHRPASIVFCYIEIPEFFAKSYRQPVMLSTLRCLYPVSEACSHFLQTPRVIELNEVQTMKKLTLIFAAIALSFSATTVLAMNGQADRYHEAQSYPNKTEVPTDDKKVSAK